jgi:hypothetical protein
MFPYLRGEELCTHGLETGRRHCPFRMQDEDNGRDVAALPQKGNGVMQGLHRCLEEEDGLVRNQPPRMILEQAFRNAPLCAPIGYPSRQESSDCACKAGGKRRPSQEKGCGDKNKPAESGCQEGQEQSTLRERVPRMDLPSRRLGHRGNTAEALPLQLPEGLLRLLPFGEIRNENGWLTYQAGRVLNPPWIGCPHAARMVPIVLISSDARGSHRRGCVSVR